MSTIGSLIDERINTILTESAEITSAINHYVEEIRRRGSIRITAPPPPDIDFDLYPLPDFPTESPISDIDELPERVYPDRDIVDFDVSSYLSEIEDLIKEVSVQSPTFDSINLEVSSVSPPEIPDELQSIESPTLDSLPSFTAPELEGIERPLLFNPRYDFDFYQDDLVIESKKFFEQIDSLLNQDLQYGIWLKQLIEKRRSDVERVIGFYEQVISILESKDFLERSELARQRIDSIISDKYDQYIEPVYDVYTANAPAFLKEKLSKLDQQIDNLVSGRADELVFSENVFKDKDRQDRLYELIMKAKEELNRQEELFVNTLVSLQELFQSYVLLYLNRVYLNAYILYEKENLLTALRDVYIVVVGRYVSLYKETYSDYYSVILKRSRAVLEYIDSILRKNNALWQAYNNQVSLLEDFVNQYQSLARTYSSRVDFEASKVSLMEGMFRINQSKQDLFEAIARKVRNMYSLRKEKIQEILTKADAEMGLERMYQQITQEKGKVLENIQRLQSQVLSTDVIRYGKEFNKWLEDIMVDYRAKVRANAVKINLLSQAYDTFVRRALKYASYLRTAQGMINDFTERLALMAFSPLAEMSNGLNSAIDAVVNGMYEFVVEA